ncbi:MAG: DoxX family protein [Deltaproteobacteria bacterium]|nr:DoxX family protein [Deltaproteobacteria bacterium]
MTVGHHEAPGTTRAWNIALWFAQVLLAVAFGMAGLMKTTLPMAELMEKLPWTADVGQLTRFIGACELLGALGMILPALTRIQPRLTALAGAGFTLLMILAAVFHLIRGEPQALLVNGTLGALAAFVAWGRHVRAPIEPRT